MPIVKYRHHGTEVYVDDELKGMHREYCLCHKCDRLVLTGEDHGRANCPMARLLFAFCEEYGMTAPVFECPFFIPIALHEDFISEDKVKTSGDKVKPEGDK